MRFDEDVISVTDDVGSVEVCLGVVDELVDDDFYFKIPILIQTVNGTAGTVCVCVCVSTEI